MSSAAGAETHPDVTFLFTDIEGSTAAWDRDEAAIDRAQARHDEILRRAIPAGSGRVFATAGDGLAAAFPRAGGAVGAAVSAQRALLAEPWPPSARLRVRMGLHTGTAIERDGDYFGASVIRAARLMSLVDGGRIVCSEATCAAVRAERGAPPDLELVPVGTVPLRGLSTPEVVFAVRAPGLPETGRPLRLENPFDWVVPRPAGPLIGRREEVEAISDAVGGSWLVTLTGIGGVGKTRLALAVADAIVDRFIDGRAFVDLAPVVADADVARAVADALRISGQPGEDLTARIGRSVASRAILVVLDNCEHVRSAVAQLLTSLGATCNNLTAVATSRERLHVDGERVIRVAPLPADDLTSDAVELLIDRVWGDHHPPVGPAEAEALVEIAGRLDGVPLALELAAARCRVLGVRDVARRLRSELGLLADRALAPARHQTLDAAIDWSYRLLTEAERAALDRLSVFAGSFSLDAAEHVVAPATTRPVETIASLVDKSLIEQDPPWFRLLEPTRQYAAVRLVASGGAAAVQRVHTEVVVEQVVRIHDALQSREEADWVRVLDKLWPDVRAVVRRSFDRGDAEVLTTLAVALAFEALWRRPEAFTWIEEAVDRYGDRPGPRSHELLAAGAMAAFTHSDPMRAIQLGEAAVAAQPEPGAAIDCLPEIALAAAYSFAGRHEDAVDLARRVIETWHGRGALWPLALARSTFAIAAVGGGVASDDLVEHLRQASTLARAIGNPTLMSFALFTHGLFVGAADAVTATSLIETARSWAAEVRNEWVTVQSSIALAAIATAAVDDEHARQAMLEAAGDLLRTGWTTHAWETVWGVIDPLHRAGLDAEAALCLGACEASGVTRYQYHRYPDDLDAASSPGGDERLRALRTMGRHIPLDDVIRIASGQAPVPPVLTGPTRRADDVTTDTSLPPTGRA